MANLKETEINAQLTNQATERAPEKMAAVWLSALLSIKGLKGTQRKRTVRYSINVVQKNEELMTYRPSGHSPGADHRESGNKRITNVEETH